MTTRRRPRAGQKAPRRTKADRTSRARAAGAGPAPAPEEPAVPVVVERGMKRAARLALAAGLEPRQTAFLVAFATCANITRASASAGVHRGQHYDWLKAPDPAGAAYRAAFGKARRIAGEVLTDQAWRLAVRGVLKPVVSAGKLVCYERVYSEKILLRLLEAHLPKRFRPRRELGVDVIGNLADLIREGRARALRS